MFSSIIGLFEKLQELKLKKQKKDTKKEVKKEEKKLKQEGSSVVNVKDKAKKTKKVKDSKEKEKKLQIKVWVLKVLKWIVEIIEQFIMFLISVIGVYGFFIILVVIVLMIVIYGLLHIDFDMTDGSLFRNKSDECIQGPTVYTSEEFSLDKVGSLLGTFKNSDKKIAEVVSVYSYIFSKDMNSVVPDSKYIGDIKKYVGKENLIFIFYGMNDTESGGVANIPVTGDSLLKKPTTIENGDLGYLSLNKNNTFNGKYSQDGASEGVEILQTSFVENVKEKYELKETCSIENNFVPYGISTQVGTFSNITLSNKYDVINSKIDTVMSNYGIGINKDILRSYIQLFAGAAGYHINNFDAMSDEDVEGLLSLWCALWASTSAEDGKRGFDSIAVVSNSVTEKGMREYIYGSSDNSMTWDVAKSGYFKIDGASVDKDLWSWVRDKCGNTDYFNSTAKVWLDKYQGTENILFSSYGFSDYLIGKYAVQHLSESMPTASGGNDEDCECEDGTGTRGVLSLTGRDFSNIQVGQVQGLYPEDIKQKMMQNTTYQPYFGESYSIEHGDEKLAGDVTWNQWRENSKWKVPYQAQCGADNYWTSKNRYMGNPHTAACPTHELAYIYSAMTGTHVNIAEITAAQMAYGGGNSSPSWGTFTKIAEDSGFFVRHMKFTGGKITDYGSSSSKESDPILYPDSSLSLKQQIDYVLEHDGIVGVTVKKGSAYTGNKHYMCITEKVGENEYYTHSATHEDLDIKPQSLETIIGANGSQLFTGFVTNLMFAHNPSLTSSNPSNPISTSVSANADERLKKVGEGLEAHKYEFAQKLARPAIEVAKEIGIYPSIILGQASLESGYGTSNYAKNHGNYFGMTAGGSNGNEVWDGKKFWDNNRYWRDYTGAEEPVMASLRDYGRNLWNYGEYSRVGTFNCIPNMETKEIQINKYAEIYAPGYENGGTGMYAKKVLSVINSFNYEILDEIFAEEGGWNGVPPTYASEEGKQNYVNNGGSLEGTPYNSVFKKTTEVNCVPKGSTGEYSTAISVGDGADHATYNVSELPGGVPKHYVKPGKGLVEPDEPVWGNRAGSNPYRVKEYVRMYDRKTGYRLGIWPKDADLSPVTVKKTYNGLIWPCDSTMQGVGYDHEGADLHAPCHTPIYAPADGTIIDSRWGNTVNTATWESAYCINLELDNPITYNGKTIKVLWFGHMTGIRYRVHDGDSNTPPIKVKQGDLIGWVGYANAPHLHLTLDYSCDIMTNVFDDFYSVKRNETRKAGE